MSLNESHARNDLLQLIFIALRAINLRKHLNDATFFSSGNYLTYPVLFFCNRANMAIKGTCVHQDVSTINPVNMGDNQIKPFGGNIFETQKHFYFFVENFYDPSHAISNDDLPGSCF